jgi:hypothetical protein
MLEWNRNRKSGFHETNFLFFFGSAVNFEKSKNWFIQPRPETEKIKKLVNFD